ncbi:hypothetical protein [Pseudoduganella umbonata]|uniref:ABC-type glycerol-3-phosphate transport system substrate-binding protein n=1 Tax=Pseudoduganella umbonata TaxID=864828 RepID=A0A4P8HRU0_9BURK|nr:hypothetical protein [Pseudoduganella umbonata]MBB3220605.1 ABC-type glycerol-3-phosphate transport system substrate-binding protein [Pseudoduganella umbonata]QCP11896.1 hypothetical protein FCL38_16835 [Pseudoduganella umbonata]
MKRLLVLSIALCFSTAAVHTAAFSQSDLSHTAGEISGVVVFGSLVAGSVIVAGSEKVSDGVELVVESVGNASRSTVRLSGEAATSLSIASGTMVDVVATSTGHALVLSGKVIAFIPNELGKALLRREKVPQ